MKKSTQLRVVMLAVFLFVQCVEAVALETAKMSETEITALLAKARHFRDYENPQDALKVCNQIINADQTNFWAYMERGRCYRDMDKWDRPR